MKNIKKSKKGFTLIELIIVIAIIAILAAITVPRLSGFRDDAKEKADIANAKIIANTISVLVADGTITSDINNANPVTFAGVLDKNTTTATVDKIEEHLQDIPVPKKSGDRFVVKFVYSTGKVTIYRATATVSNEVANKGQVTAVSSPEEIDYKQ